MFLGSVVSYRQRVLEEEEEMKEEEEEEEEADEEEEEEIVLGFPAVLLCLSLLSLQEDQEEKRSPGDSCLSFVVAGPSKTLGETRGR